MKKDLSKENKRFNYLFGETDAVYHEIALKLGLSDSAMQILYAICDGDGSCFIRDICRFSGLSKQTVNSALRKLEQDDMIILNQADTKFKSVSLTHAGQKLAEETALRVIEMENAIFASWSREEVDTYLQLTEKYLIDLKEKAKTL